MRKVGRLRRKKQKKILIIGSLSLLLFLCVGYAAFSTELSLKAKGNIKEKSAADILKENVVESGDGLYKDIYEDNKYVYKGVNPNNYIIFNGEMWRIVAIESDGSIKIIRDSVIEGNFILEDINTQLNTFLTTLDTKNIINHDWQVYSYDMNIDVNTTLADIINEENNSFKSFVSKNIGIITIGEYMRANTNVSECETVKLIADNYNKCKSTNWLNFLDGKDWWITYKIFGSDCVRFVVGVGCVLAAEESYAWSNIRPSLYLSSNIKIIEGDGSKDNPYQIEN